MPKNYKVRESCRNCDQIVPTSSNGNTPIHAYECSCGVRWCVCYECGGRKGPGKTFLHRSGCSFNQIRDLCKYCGGDSPSVSEPDRCVGCRRKWGLAGMWE